MTCEAAVRTFIPPATRSDQCPRSLSTAAAGTSPALSDTPRHREAAVPLSDSALSTVRRRSPGGCPFPLRLVAAAFASVSIAVRGGRSVAASISFWRAVAASTEMEGADCFRSFSAHAVGFVPSVRTVCSARDSIALTALGLTRRIFHFFQVPFESRHKTSLEHDLLHSPEFW